ncbi:hypothetical protein GGH94_002987 [Coemansia aciculifera]|uniref:Uncharacterized protein n=1 Tax=Coemansia aciculifera TaxID=417176 RepID=A0A9W8IKW7_9FUNG|nr:hypothetical protein GGH94_002987 [Coemansia aciculifera]KAJ2873862.1 hypothetical protein GGH93_002872 [Coemansia aciculifera]
MYDSGPHGNHSHSTPASPNTYINSTQPTEGRATYDKELASLFRATAANVTQLYKEASDIGQNAYKTGYEQCYSDIWEFLATTHQPELLLTGGEGHQMAMQRLVEFARLKRLAPPRTVHFGSASSSSGRILSGQIHGQQNQLSPGSQDLTVSTASVVSAPVKQVDQQQFEPCQKSGVASPALRRAASAAGDVVSVSSTSNPSVPGAQSGGGSSSQRLMRGKRSLDPFDLMDIEPPRRRQRKDDIEMA